MEGLNNKERKNLSFLSKKGAILLSFALFSIFVLKKDSNFYFEEAPKDLFLKEQSYSNSRAQEDLRKDTLEKDIFNKNMSLERDSLKEESPSVFSFKSLKKFFSSDPKKEGIENSEEEENEEKVDPEKEITPSISREEPNPKKESRQIVGVGGKTEKSSSGLVEVQNFINLLDSLSKEKIRKDSLNGDKEVSGRDLFFANKISFLEKSLPGVISSIPEFKKQNKIYLDSLECNGFFAYFDSLSVIDKNLNRNLRTNIVALIFDLHKKEKLSEFFNTEGLGFLERTTINLSETFDEKVKKREIESWQKAFEKFEISFFVKIKNFTDQEILLYLNKKKIPQEKIREIFLEKNLLFIKFLYEDTNSFASDLILVSQGKSPSNPKSPLFQKYKELLKIDKKLEQMFKKFLSFLQGDF